MTFRAVGTTDAGSQRVVNEDRFHVDPDRGIFIVVDGVGGQAAGGRAADTALDVVRTHLTRDTNPIATRLRAAITAANNEIHRQAASRAEWNGMACVLTAAVIDGHRAVVGHVGDTRLYKLRGGSITKITPDHSPVGEREDAGEISELDAMRHPRRNEVYRDVGSEPHETGDTDFIDVRETTWEPDAALLLCSDGLTDLVASDAIQRIVRKSAGHPDQVARELVKAANDAGGRDNITVVYVEGERFASNVVGRGGVRPRARHLLPLTATLILVAALGAAWRSAGYPIPDAVANALRLTSSGASVVVVRPGESIAAALLAAEPGATILVEPGEYRERLTLRSDIRLVSLVSRGATLRLPEIATDQDAAVRAVDAANAELAGFRIVGDAATPLGTGILTRSSSVRLIDLEVTGAARAAIDLGPGDAVMLLASDIHDNPGAGLMLRAAASPRIAHNTFAANGSSERAAAAIAFEPGTRPVFTGNVFRNVDPQSLTFLDPAARAQLRTVNWFPDARPVAAPGRGRGPAEPPRLPRGGR